MNDAQIIIDALTKYAALLLNSLAEQEKLNKSLSEQLEAALKTEGNKVTE